MSIRDVQDAPFFTLNGMETEAEIVKVYDGDTVHALMEVFGTMYRWKCRIMHVDTPEIRSADAHEKEIAYKARDALSDLVLNKIVRVKCFNFDLYGRVLVELVVPMEEENDIVVHDWLLCNGYANRYEGKNKQKFN